MNKKRWIIAGVAVLGVMAVGGALLPDEEPVTAAPEPTAAAPVTTEPEPQDTPEPEPEPAGPTCEDAPAQAVENIEAGLTVDGELVDAVVVPVAEENQNSEGWPAVIVAARIDAEGIDPVASWATGEEGAGPIMALNSMAREFSDWGAAAQDGSRAAEVRDMLADYDETAAAEDCAGS